MEKKLLRKEVLITLKSQPQAYKSEVDCKLLEAFIKTKAYQNSCVIATYLSLNKLYVMANVSLFPKLIQKVK